PPWWPREYQDVPPSAIPAGDEPLPLRSRRLASRQTASFIGEVVFKAHSGHKSDDGMARAHHVVQKVAEVPFGRHRVMASARRCWPMWGLSAAADTRSTRNPVIAASRSSRARKEDSETGRRNSTRTSRSLLGVASLRTRDPKSAS